MIKKELQQELNRTKLVLDYARQEIEEKDKEIKRLNNIIKRLKENLREMYLIFGEFSEEYTENRIRKLKIGDKE